MGPIGLGFGPKLAPNSGLNPCCETENRAHLAAFYSALLVSPSRRRGLGKRTEFQYPSPHSSGQMPGSLGSGALDTQHGSPIVHREDHKAINVFYYLTGQDKSSPCKAEDSSAKCYKEL